MGHKVRWEWFFDCVVSLHAFFQRNRSKSRERGDNKELRRSLSRSKSRERRFFLISPRGKGSQEDSPFSPFDYVPDEIIIHILTFLDLRDLAATALVAQRWKRLSGDDFVWQQLCVRLHCCKGHLDDLTTSGRFHFFSIREKIKRYGTYLQTQNRTGNSPLHREIVREATTDEEIISVVEHGVDVNIRNKDGATPLFLVIGRGRGPETVRCLVQHGALISLKNKYGDALLHLAVVQSSDSTLRALLDAGADINIRNQDGDTPLHRAARFGALSAVKWLVQHGASLSDRNENGFTPLHYATYNEHLFTVRWMVEQGADLNVRNHFGDTPMHAAAAQGHQATVHWLWQHGADVNALNHEGSSPLHRAAVNGHQKTAHWLVEHGSDPKSRNNDGDTPLHSAIKLRHYRTVEYLISLQQPSRCQAAPNPPVKNPVHIFV